MSGTPTRHLLMTSYLTQMSEMLLSIRRLGIAFGLVIVYLLGRIVW